MIFERDYDTVFLMSHFFLAKRLFVTRALTFTSTLLLYLKSGIHERIYRRRNMHYLVLLPCSRAPLLEVAITCLVLNTVPTLKTSHCQFTNKMNTAMSR